jgi:hypothetical protein
VTKRQRGLLLVVVVVDGGIELVADANLELRLGLCGAVELLPDACDNGVQGDVGAGRVRIALKEKLLRVRDANEDAELSSKVSAAIEPR